jgi:arginine-tRNA-protein transferase
VHPLGIEIIPAEKKAFNVNYPDFISFCTYYAADRFVGGSMSEERLQYLLHRETLSHIFTFRSQDKLYGYVFAVLAQNMLHYWFSFFDVTYLQSHSMGKWMMWRMIHWAQEKGLDFVYLGTCYKAKALYKIRDHKGVEFFDGVGWNENMNMLKFLCQTDEAETPKNCDLLKRSDKTADMVFKNLHD